MRSVFLPTFAWARPVSCHAAALILGVLLATPSAYSQDWWRVYPTNPANDTWYTGVTELSPDGRWAGGWQTPSSSSTSTAPAVWDTETRAPRAQQPGRQGYLRDLGSTPRTQVGNTSGPFPWAGWRCLDTGEQYCEDLPTFRTIWACSDDGATVLGFIPSPDGLVMPAVLRPDGSFKSAFLSQIQLTEVSLSGDGSVAYFLGGSPIEYLYRWETAGDSPPEPLRIRRYLERLAGVSEDGSVAYYASEVSLEKYSHPGLWESISGWGPGTIYRVTRDGRWGTGLRPYEGPEPTGKAGFLWDPFNGSIDLTELLPEFPTSLGRVMISDDGSTIAGTYRPSASSARSVGFVGKLPASLRGASGDYSTDGNLDQDDIAEFIGLLAGAQNPAGLPLDFNRDEAVDTADLSDLVTFVAGGGEP